MFSQLASQHEISISFENLKIFILAVRAGMPSNPYHNWKHVVDVTQVRTHNYQLQLFEQG